MKRHGMHAFDSRGLRIPPGTRPLIEPGDTVKMLKGIWAMRRRMLDGKRRTLHVQIGAPTDEELATILRLTQEGDGNEAGVRALVKTICDRYKKTKT